MNIKIMEEFLLWCGVINFGLFLSWFLFFTLAHDKVTIEYRMNAATIEVKDAKAKDAKKK